MLLVTALALTGCGAGDSSSDSAGDSKAAAPDGGGANAQKTDSGAAGSDSATGRRATAPTKLSANSIIRTASLTVRVKDVPQALDDTRTTVESAGGYVGNETTTRDGEGRERTRVVLRVPTERYDQVLADLEGTGKVLERTAKAQDVTDEVVDVRSRIASQRASVARVRELMDKATKLSDVVTLEGELSSREADLEALLARQASLKDRTSLATITLSLSQTAVRHAEKKDDDPGFLDALAGGWNVLVTMIRWLALAIGAVLPFAAGAALIAAVWLFVVRPRLRPRPATAAAAGPATASGPAAVPASRPSPGAGPDTAAPQAGPPADGRAEGGGERD
ncbi:DUF4349 domain-containing protein [Streptomyces sp. NBC_01558]|uniref:DUF4349 domain-containing protein n=1 Tax=Streptomyces sp. NBC_01558 TaxID=2975878 RepID=UPI002DD9B2F0|nr:DUF4349 domain-containing protein [Streptomyces sp. NBC_01558]WSD77009.1 DUF4349 domain-containing protein [Streptomyces sp. NBC_01558]